jgi:hypothetical protein
MQEINFLIYKAEPAVGTKLLFFQEDLVALSIAESLLFLKKVKAALKTFKAAFPLP